MVRQYKNRANSGRKNNGHACYCSTCKCYVQHIRRHEQTKKHRNNIDQFQDTSNHSSSFSSTNTNTSINEFTTEESDNPSLPQNNDRSDQNDTNSVDYGHIFDNDIFDNYDYHHRDSISHSSTSTSSSETELSLNDNDDHMSHFDSHSEYTMNMEEYLKGEHFSREKVDHRMSSLAKYNIQIKLLKIFNDQGVSPKIFDIVTEWIKENFDFKPTIYPEQELRSRDSLMKYMDQTYGDIAGGSIHIKDIEVDNTNCVVHRIGFLKSMYHLLNNKSLMIDAEWKPKNIDSFMDENISSEKVFSEVTSGNWYQRTYNQMIIKHRRNITQYPPLLVAVILGQDATLCDKIGRVSSEPILVSIANIKYNKRKNNNAWFCIGFVPSYPKTQLESQKDANRIATKELSNEFYHSCISFILDELIQVQKMNGIKMKVNINGQVCMRTCYFEVAFHLGDAAGNKKLCGHYTNFSGNIARK